MSKDKNHPIESSEIESGTHDKKLEKQRSDPRRNLLKTGVSASLVATLDAWKTPVVSSVINPVHAKTSLLPLRGTIFDGDCAFAEVAENGNTDSIVEPLTPNELKEKISQEEEVQLAKLWLKKVADVAISPAHAQTTTDDSDECPVMEGDCVTIVPPSPPTDGGMVSFTVDGEGTCLLTLADNLLNFSGSCMGTQINGIFNADCSQVCGSIEGGGCNFSFSAEVGGSCPDE